MPTWCLVVRPALYAVFSGLEMLIQPFFSSAADKLRTIWGAIAGGDGSNMDVNTCLGSLALSIPCQSPEKQVNSTDAGFVTAPIASRCWADAQSEDLQSAGAGPFGGGSASAALLGCTASDTCAQVLLLLGLPQRA